MHDIGSSQRELEWGSEVGQEFEQEFPGEFEFEGGPEGEFGNEFESAEFGEAGELGAGTSSEALELELATELLSVTNEQEMEQFLGKLFKGATRAVGGFIKSPIGRSLGGMLRTVAKTALPTVGAALGNLVVPGLGGVVGGKLASLAGNAMGLELEGLSPEDKEFELARRVVRLGRSAALHANRMPATAPPVAAARQAFVRAARQVAPSLLSTMRGIAQGAINTAASSAGQAFGTAAGQYLGGAPRPFYAPEAPVAGQTRSGACPVCSGGSGRLATWRRSRDGRGIVVYVKLR